MGEVYRAEDTSLGREVAIKVLPEELTGDAERMARFEREAHILASLNHPNIAGIYEVGEDGGVHFLAMELAQGVDLADRLGQGAIPLEEALPIALQIATGLEAAHERGIVHRDLKPANIKIAPGGEVKILDFGLAKAWEDSPVADGSISLSPTLTAQMTQAGVILGTAAYMSPEQARGMEVDKRADIWAFGVVVWEMLTGQRAFRGETVSDTLAAILKEEPDWSQLPEQMPPEARQLLRRCLDRDPSTRLRDIGEARVLLGDPDLGGSSALSDVSDAPPQRSGWLRALPLALGLLVMGSAGGWWLGRNAATPASRDDAPVLRFSTESEVFSGSYNRPLAISDDGRMLATAILRGIRIQDLASGEVHYLDGEELALRRMPFLSPDGERAAWWEAGRIHWSPIDESAPPSSAPFPTRPTGATWGEDGFLYVGRGSEGIWRVDSRGGEPELIAEVEEGELADGPELLPDGEWLLFSVARSMSGWDEARIVAHSLVSGERRMVLEGGREVRYASSGHLLFVRQGVLLGVPFDWRSLSVQGTPQPLLDGVATSTMNHTGASFYDVSVNGTLIWASALLPERVALALVDLEGREERLSIKPSPFTHATLSPSNRHIATEVTKPVTGSDVWVYPVDSTGGPALPTVLATEGVNRHPVWSHDGESVYFASDRSGTLDIWRRRADANEPAEVVVERIGDQVPADISQDGRWLYFTEESPGNRDIYRVSLEPGSEPETVLATEHDEASPSLSPDGTHLVFETDATAEFQVVVLELTSGRRWSVQRGYFPHWAPNGSRVFYWDGTQQNVVAWVEIETEPEIVISAARGSVEHQVSYTFRLDVTRQGDQILTAVPVEDDPDSEPGPVATEAKDAVNFVVNWFEELEAALPTDG